ncbi:transcription factor SAC51-like [Salvia splendens]|nr:transcription factor SAC51-like [Salvia splendens]XP_042042970.1 transcription factor SAC51-like [Salvia splendens]XP_042042976.1 transcription factor SAC51-like [Salvia splendens]
MATAKESQAHQKFTARNSSYTDHMGMYYCQRTTAANDVIIEQCASDSPSLNAGQQGAVGGSRLPHCNIRYATEDPYRKGSHCIIDRQPVGAPQRRFLIFDQSKNHTRLFFSPSFSSLSRMFLSKTPASANGSFAKVDTPVNRCILMKPVVEEKWDENHPSYGEGEMDEDTDEINALLYSDSDEDDNSEDDEVTSTGHSLPLSLDEITEEVASSDHKSSKRKRLLDGRDEKSSFETSRRLRYSGDDDSGKKVKIREALKMLESIIPGLDESNPLSIIDGAVAYLKSMKSEAESLRRRKGATWTP